MLLPPPPHDTFACHIRRRLSHEWALTRIVSNVTASLALRRRRGSLHYKHTGSLAEVAELLGDSKRVAADHYVYALTDYRELDRSIPLARALPRA